MKTMQNQLLQQHWLYFHWSFWPCQVFNLGFNPVPKYITCTVSITKQCQTYLACTENPNLMLKRFAMGNQF